MAARKKAVARRGESTAMVSWEEQMARDADVAAGMEARIGASQFFSTKGGMLKFNDQPIPDNEMAVIVLDYCIEKNYYDEDYDPENPVPPVCYAFTRGDELEMVPHSDAPQPQSEQCDGCDWNEFGSAERGQGKACRDHRRLALLSAGRKVGNDWEIDEDPENYENQQFALLRLPPTSLKAWATYVKQIRGALSRPPYGVITLVKIVPDPKNQFAFSFHLLGKVPDDLMPTIMERHRQCEQPGIIDFPYTPLPEEKPTARRTTKKRTAKKTAAKKKTSARRARRY